MTIKAGMDRVLIKPEAIPEATETGLILSLNKKDTRPLTGTVVSIGSPLYAKQAPEGLAVGDQVFFKDYAGAEFTYEGELYYALLYEEVAGYVSA